MRPGAWWLAWMTALALAPLFMGLTHWARARLQGRAGPAPWQPYADLGSRVRQVPVWPRTASLVFGLAPYLNLFIYALLLAWVAGLAAPGGPVDLLTPIFLMALARFSLGLAALDTGTPLMALGGSRTLFLHLLAEPTLVALACAATLHNFSLNMGAQPDVNLFGMAARVLIGGGLWGVLLLEGGRLPFDNPDGQLELTMIEAGATLEYAGPEWAALEWAGALRLLFFFNLMAYLLPPALPAPVELTLESWAALLVHLAKVGVLSLALAVWEMPRPKARLRAVDRMAMIPLLLALVAIIFGVIQAR